MIIQVQTFISHPHLDTLMKRSFLTLATLSLAVGAAWSQTVLPPIAQDTEATFTELTAHGKVQQAVDFLKSDDERTLKEQIELTEIPSPPYKEAVRAQDYQKRLKALGLQDARIDAEGNVIAVRKGSGNGPVLVVSAHLDTVFPEGTDVKVKVKGNRYEAPGIYDDGRGLASLLSVLRSLNHTGLKTVGDIIFVGTVGEEELGDLRGVKALFRDNKAIDGFISLDGLDIGRVGSQFFCLWPAVGHPRVGPRYCQDQRGAHGGRAENHFHSGHAQGWHLGQCDCGRGRTRAGHALEQRRRAQKTRRPHHGAGA